MSHMIFEQSFFRLGGLQNVRMSRSVEVRFSEGKIGKFIPYHFLNSYNTST